MQTLLHNILNRHFFMMKNRANHTGFVLQWFHQYRTPLLIAAAIALLQMMIWKYLYPYPNFLPDSYSYIEAALHHQYINKWPIGYSWFLRTFSMATRSHSALVWLQYILLQAAIGYLLFTIYRFVQPGKWLFNMLLFGAVCNPLTYQVSNLVSADALFTTLSLIYFGQVIWLINQPTLRLFILHAIVLFLAFIVRYNALYYPLISLLIMAFSSISLRKRLTGIIVTCLLTGAFIGFTQYHYQKLTGWVQFSPFGGWQLSSNALYAYSRVPPNERLYKYDVKDLQNITNRHIDSVQQLPQRPDAQLGAYYLWNEHSPLQQHMQQIIQTDRKMVPFARWAWMGIRYHKFGMWLIKHYPGAYIQFYILPNLVNYYIPQPEFLGAYNMEKSVIEKTGVEWFRLKNNKINHAATAVLEWNQYMPVALAITNLLFAGSFIGLVWLKGLKTANRPVKKTFTWFMIVWLINMAFSVLASPIVLRYQLFPMLVTQTGLLLCIEYIIRASRVINLPQKEQYNQVMAGV